MSPTPTRPDLQLHYTLTFSLFFLVQPMDHWKHLTALHQICATLRVCERRPVCRPQGGFLQKADCANEPFAREGHIHDYLYVVDTHALSSSICSSCAVLCCAVPQSNDGERGMPNTQDISQLAQYQAGRSTSEGAYLPSWPIQQFRRARAPSKKGPLFFSVLTVQFARHVSSVVLAYAPRTN